MKGVFILFFFVMSFFWINPADAYQRIGKNSKAYYYTYPKPRPPNQWDRNGYKSYYYYDHNVYPQYTYTYPGHSYFYAYPNYYHNDKGDIYFFWGY